MTLAEAVSQFESRFTVVSDDIGFSDGVSRRSPDRRDWSRCPTGARYVAITNGGIKPEGNPWPALNRTEEAGIEAWLREAVAYADGKGSRLHWRERPEVEWLQPPRSRVACVVYSRFVVTE